MRIIIHSIMKIINRITRYSIWGKDSVPEISMGDENLDRFDFEGYKL